jgi:HD-like signal output (HDOD) protein
VATPSEIDPDAGELLLPPPVLAREGGPDVLVRLSGARDLFAYFGCSPGEPPAVRAAAVTARRRWAQGQRDNPKFRAEAEALLRSFDACFRAVVEAPPVEVVARSTSPADDEDVDDPVTNTEGLWRLPPPVARLTVAATTPLGRPRELPLAAPPVPAPALAPAAALRSPETSAPAAAFAAPAAPFPAPAAASGEGLGAWWSAWWRTLFAAAPASRSPSPDAAARASGPAAPPALVVAPEPPPWDGLERVPDSDLSGLRVALLEHLYALRDRAPGPAERAFVERLLRTCSVRQLQFPLFPDSALELQSAIADEDVSFAHLAGIVRRDPALLQRVWEEASGAAFGRQRPVSVEAAVVRIGRRAIWRIGMRACVNAPVFRVRGWQERATELRSAGIVAAEVAEVLDPTGAAFLPALLHGVGRLLVYRAAAPRPPRPTPDRAWVERVAQALQAPLGALVSETWQLGAPVSAGIAFLPDPAQALPGDRRTAEGVRAAMIATHEARANLTRRSFGGADLLRASGFPDAQVDRALRVATGAWGRVARLSHLASGR